MAQVPINSLNFIIDGFTTVLIDTGFPIFEPTGSGEIDFATTGNFVDRLFFDGSGNADFATTGAFVTRKFFDGSGDTDFATTGNFVDRKFYVGDTTNMDFTTRSAIMSGWLDPMHGGSTEVWVNGGSHTPNTWTNVSTDPTPEIWVNV